MTLTPLLRMFPKISEGTILKKCQRLLLKDQPVPFNSRAQYGTAGFRYKVDSINDIDDDRIPPLDAIMIRVGMAAVIRSRHLQEAVGVMVTASHNDETYNGVKLVDPDGGVTTLEGEELAMKFVNEPNIDSVIEWCALQGVEKASINAQDGDNNADSPKGHSRRTSSFSEPNIEEFLDRKVIRPNHSRRTSSFSEPNMEELLLKGPRPDHHKSLSFSGPSGAPRYIPLVHIGHDLRSHSPRLAQCVAIAARCLGATVLHHGVVTTPQLHHVVLHSNARHVPILIPTSPNVKGYYELVANAYLAFVGTMSPGTALSHASHSHSLALAVPPTTLLVDCACGVGFPHVQLLQEKLNDLTNGASPVQLYAANRHGSGPLNEDCGSEHVQKHRAPCKWYEQDVPSDKSYCASLDGDSDRIVFFSEQQLSPLTGNVASTFFLLDGDKMSCLICQFIQHELSTLTNEAASASLDAASILPPPLSIGVVQTAYANGASTAYLKRILGDDNVRITKTGVKHLHVVASTFDIGIYFEANGHGTVLFGPNFYTYISQASAIMKKAAAFQLEYSSRSNAWISLERLKALPLLVNQAIGDGLSDLLLVDGILRMKEWDLSMWNNVYADLPSCQRKVPIAKRNVLKTNDNETQCLEPAVVQDELNAAMERVGGSARVFVRASGTEDVIRVYAEADTTEAAQQLAECAVKAVHEHCHGLGELEVPVSIDA